MIVKTLARLVNFLALGISAGCTTIYFHNGHSTAPTTDQPLFYQVSQSETIISLIEGKKPIDLAETCGAAEWQTIKSENSWKDLLIRAIGSPVYSTVSIEYECRTAAAP